MPYKDRKKQQKYMREWMASRRAAWFSVNGPCSKCGSAVDLQLHHKDRTRKISHRIFSWTEKRRLRELAKCIVLCRHCHDEETVLEGARIPATHGTMARYLVGGCRCGLCVTRRRAYLRYYRLRRKAREGGVVITKAVEGVLRERAAYPAPSA